MTARQMPGETGEAYLTRLRTGGVNVMSLSDADYAAAKAAALAYPFRRQAQPAGGSQPAEPAQTGADLGTTSSHAAPPTPRPSSHSRDARHMTDAEYREAKAAALRG